MNYKITHKTEYSYTHPVNLCYNEVRLTPRNFAYQQCGESHLSVEPEPKEYRKRKDFFGNTVYYFTIQQPHNQLTVTVTSYVAVKGREQQQDFAEHLAWEAAHQQITLGFRSRNSGDAAVYSQIPNGSAKRLKLRDYAEKSFTNGRPLLEAVEDLTTRLYTDFTYDSELHDNCHTPHRGCLKASPGGLPRFCAPSVSAAYVLWDSLRVM